MRFDHGRIHHWRDVSRFGFSVERSLIANWVYVYARSHYFGVSFRNSDGRER